MSESTVIRKQFIAGAICPTCNAQDSIKMWNVEGTPHRECVSCGYTDTFNEQGNPVPQEPNTRLSKPVPRTLDPQVQPLRFVELKPKKA